MKIKNVFLFLTLILLFSLTGCVPSSDYEALSNSYDSLKKENDKLLLENQQLKAQLDNGNNTNSSSSDENNDEEIKEDETVDITTEEIQQQDIEYRKDVTYEDLSRKPGDYEGEYIEMTGEVIQLIESETDETELRIATNSNGYDDVLYAAYDPSIVDERILEEDKVIVRGMYMGIIQYESTLGGIISVPAIYVTEIERQ